MLVLVWQDGHGSRAIWGLPVTGAITGWIPLFVFAFVYGLSMDYEVFLLTRMREEYDRTGSTTAAVVTGIGRTGRLITSAALILFLAMAALASAPFTLRSSPPGWAPGSCWMPLWSARCWSLPLVSLFGRWNWWLPAWAAAILRVRLSPVAARTREPAMAAPGNNGPVSTRYGVQFPERPRCALRHG